MKKKDLIGIACMVMPCIMVLASSIIQDTLGNNYRDIYNPFWISVSCYLLLGAFVWTGLTLVVLTIIDDKETTRG